MTIMQEEVTEALKQADAYARGMNSVRVPDPELIDDLPAIEAAERE